MSLLRRARDSAATFRLIVALVGMMSTGASVAAAQNVPSDSTSGTKCGMPSAMRFHLSAHSGGGLYDPRLLVIRFQDGARSRQIRGTVAAIELIDLLALPCGGAFAVNGTGVLTLSVDWHGYVEGQFFQVAKLQSNIPLDSGYVYDVRMMLVTEEVRAHLPWLPTGDGRAAVATFDVSGSTTGDSLVVLWYRKLREATIIR